MPTKSPSPCISSWAGATSTRLKPLKLAPDKLANCPSTRFLSVVSVPYVSAEIRTPPTAVRTAGQYLLAYEMFDGDDAAEAHLRESSDNPGRRGSRPGRSSSRR